MESKWCIARLAIVSWCLSYAGWLQIDCRETLFADSLMERIKREFISWLSFILFLIGQDWIFGLLTAWGSWNVCVILSIWPSLRRPDCIHSVGLHPSLETMEEWERCWQWPQGLGPNGPKGVCFESPCWQQLQPNKWPGVWEMDEGERIWISIKWVWYKCHGVPLWSKTREEMRMNFVVGKFTGERG